MEHDGAFPLLTTPATKADVIDALLLMQQIASELADAILAGESDDRSGVVTAMKKYLAHMREATTLVDRLGGGVDEQR